jgi:hypothetical protein
MKSAVFGCPARWERWLPPDTRRFCRSSELAEWSWDLLALTPTGCRQLETAVRCRRALVAGDCPAEKLVLVRAETVIPYGLSPRDSLTLSSLREPVLCVQRTLARPDGGLIEPQELPLLPLPAPAEELLPLLGLRLLRMPLTDPRCPW